MDAAKKEGRGQANLDLYRRATCAGQERRNRSDPERHVQSSTIHEEQKSRLEEFMANLSVEQAHALLQESEGHLASVRVKKERAQREYCALLINRSQTTHSEERYQKTASLQK